MGHSQDEKTASHDRIVHAAAVRIREQGTSRPGVADIMRDAGMTHGGFYKHFGSRDELLAEAVERALVDSQAIVDEVKATSDDPLAAFVDAYVSEAHRDTPGTGCGVAALAPDVSRMGDRTRGAFTRQVDRYLTELEALLRDRRQAAVTLSAMVGALMIARGLGPGAESDALLRDVRQTLRRA